MKNHNPAGRRLRFSTGVDRLMVIAVTIVFVALLWAAWSGRFDREIDAGARWLERGWDRAAAFVRRIDD